MKPVTVRIGRSEVTVTPTIVDRVISYFSPERGINRLRARTQMAIAGGYTGARRDRKQTSSWNPGNGDADSVILPDLPDLRDRTRDLERNSPLAAGVINTKVTNVVGTGLKPRASIDRDILSGLTEEQADAWERSAEQEFRLATGSKDFDVERQLSFLMSQDLVFRSQLSSGDVFVNLPRIPRPGNPYTLRINLIEADRVSNPGFKADTKNLVAGIEKNDGGTPVQFHVSNFHPGNRRFTGTREWKPLKAFDADGRPLALHVSRKKRIGQTRGVPDLAPVIELLKQLSTYTDNELQAAVVSSLLTVVIKSSNPNPELVDQNEKAKERINTDGIKLGSGSVIGLWPDEDISIVDPKRPNVAAQAFLHAMAEQIGVALEMPFEILVKHFTASYSAAQAALLEFWRYVLACRFWLAVDYCQPIWEAVISEAVALGRLPAPGFFSDPLIRMAYLGCEWIGDARGHIDENKAVNAATSRVDEGFSTLAEETVKLTGGDWERNHRQQVKERRMRDRDGLTPVEKQPAAPVEPQPPVEPDADDRNDLEDTNA